MNIEIIKGKDLVYRAMLATKAKRPAKNKTISNELWFKMLRAKHSPIEEFEIWIDAIVPERVHTHLVRHEEIGKYIATSRPDIKDSITQTGFRNIALRINAKRLIEISEQRLCADSWIETTDFVKSIVNNLPDETLKIFCIPQCVRAGCCIGTKQCGYDKTTNFKLKRESFMNFENNF